MLTYNKGCVQNDNTICQIGTLHSVLQNVTQRHFYKLNLNDLSVEYHDLKVIISMLIIFSFYPELLSI